jgi:hypothetical protein
MKNIILSALSFVLLSLFAVPAYALSVTAAATANVSVGSTTVSASTQAKITTAISRADQEITRRVTLLTQLNTNVQAMVKVSATEKSAIATEVQTEISSLTSLKATIDAETSITSLRTDIQSITKDYRIFMLVIPQGRIEVAADKIETVVSDYSTLSTTLQARIAAAPAGTDTTQVNAWLSDMNTQTASANAQAEAAVSLVANLQPDQGNATIQASNTAALKSAAADIKTALADLKTARTDAGDIVKAIESWKVSTSASSTISTQ